MKIIKKGKRITKTGGVIFECENCECVFVAERSEYKEQAEYYTVECPNCGTGKTELIMAFD